MQHAKDSLTTLKVEGMHCASCQAPMVGGMVSATILTLAVIPAVFLLWQSWKLDKQSSGAGK